MIILNARFSNQDLTGVQRVGYELGKRLLRRRQDVVAISPQPPRAEYDLPVEVVESVMPSLGGHFWEQSKLRQIGNRNRLIVNLGGTGPISYSKQIVMIHDVNYLLGPSGYSKKFRRLYTYLHRNLTRNARILTISNWAAETISTAFGIPIEQMSIISHSADHIDDITADPGTLSRYRLNKRPYFLCLGSANPNKNFATALSAYSHLEEPVFDLVIAGGANSAIFQREKGLCDNPNVHRLPRISDEELKELMQKAKGFLMPSLLEGFGIPAIEAMRVGTPAIVSNASALPEVCADAALYFDPLDASALAEAMTEISRNSDLAHQLSMRGRHHAKNFSWDRSAERLDAIINETLGL